VERPEAKNPADIVPVATQTEKQHGQGLPLRLVEYRQEIRAAQERQGRDIAYGVHAHNGNEGQTEDHHQGSMRPARPVEQSVKNPEQINKFDRANHFGGDAEAEKPFGSNDIAGGCRRVPRHHQPARDIDDAEEASHPVDQLQHARDPRHPLG
jgi:hypothetical protein